MLYDSELSALRVVYTKCVFVCVSVCVCVCSGVLVNLRCVLRLLFTWPWPEQPGVGHFKTFSCMARTTDTQHMETHVSMFNMF